MEGSISYQSTTFGLLLLSQAELSIDAARTFDIIWILTGGGPRFSSEVLSTQIYRTLTRYGDVGISSATAVLFTLGLMLVSALAYKVITSGNSQTEVS